MTGARSTKSPSVGIVGHSLHQLVASLALICLSAPLHAAQPIELIVNQVAPPNHFYHKDVLVPWAEDVARVTEGRVKLRFSVAPLGSYRRNFDSAWAGLVDIAGGTQHWFTVDKPIRALSDMHGLKIAGPSIVGTIRYACSAGDNYIAYYNRWQPHRSLGLIAPCPHVKEPKIKSAKHLIAKPVLGVLHHLYQWAAWQHRCGFYAVHVSQ